MRPRHWLARVASIIAWSLASFAMLTLGAWIIGRILTDRFFWSQWLFWIPTPVVIGAVLSGMVASIRPAGRHARRNRLLRWGTCGLALIVYFLLIEHRFFRSASPLPPPSSLADGLHIVHWNAQDRQAKPEAVIVKLRELDADVTILTDMNYATRLRLMEDPLEIGQPPALFGFMMVISRVPIKSVRPFVNTPDLMFIALVELETTDRLGRAVNMYIVDMPSDPRLPRAELMRKARRLMEQATAPHPPPPADLVVGDFNIPRGSHSISLLFPDMRDAFEEAGHGYGATYYRRWPLYHIDHVLLAPTLRAWRSDIIDPGFGRHRMQEVWILNPNS